MKVRIMNLDMAPKSKPCKEAQKQTVRWPDGTPDYYWYVEFPTLDALMGFVQKKNARDYEVILNNSPELGPLIHLLGPKT